MNPSQLSRVIGDNVKARRKERGLSQTALGDAVGLTHARISQIEAGEAVVPSDTLAQLAEALHTTPAALVSVGNFSAIPA